MIKSSFGIQRVDAKIKDFLKSIPAPDQKKLSILSSLVKDWDKIVGSENAVLSNPRSVRFERGTNKAKLIISVKSSAAGFVIKNSSDSIIKNISSVCGEAGIIKIIVRHT